MEARRGIVRERSAGKFSGQLAKLASHLPAFAGRMLSGLAVLAVMLPSAFYLTSTTFFDRSPAASNNGADRPIVQRNVTVASLIPQAPLPLTKPEPATAAQPTEQIAVPAPRRTLTAGRIAELMQRAALLTDAGDISAARLVLMHVAEAGQADAALALAHLYDPAKLAERNAGDIDGNLTEARRWYVAADAWGNSSAAADLARLQQR